MIFTLRPPRRHDFLCDGGAIGNDGNKCETVTPHCLPAVPVCTLCLQQGSEEPVPVTKSATKVRGRLLAIKYKKQIHLEIGISIQHLSIITIPPAGSAAESTPRSQSVSHRSARA